MKTSLLTFLTLVFLSSISYAQDLDTTSFSGRITDQNGALIPSVEIKVSFVKSSASRTTTTNNDGIYKFIQLEPGNYLVSVSRDGFASAETSITTVAGQTVTLDFTLKPSEINSDPVVVSTNDTPLIDTKRTVVGATLNMHETQLLPIPSRSPLDLVFILPSVTEEPLSTRDLAEDRNANANKTPEEAGIFSLAGSPAYSNNLTIDGMDNNDDRAARERFQPPLEAIEEVQVITNQFSAEYGRASGGRVNLRTRSGSNEFRGRGFYFFRDEALDANTFRNNSLGLSRLPLQEHVGGLTVSGPVKLARRDLNTVFFIAYEANKVLDSALIDTLLPVEQNKLFPLPEPTNLKTRRLEDVNDPALAAEVAPFVSAVSTPSNSRNMTARVDQQFTPMHNLTGVYQLGRLHNLRQFGGGNRLAESLPGTRRNSDAFSVSDNFVFNATQVNQMRFQYSRLSPSFIAGANNPVVLITLNDPLAEGDLDRRSGTLVAGSSTSGSTQRRESRHQFQDIFSLVAGNHALKFGGDFHRIRSEFIDLSDATGTYNFASAGDFLANLPTRFRQTFGATSIQKNSYLSSFVQDEWQLLPQLLLTYGLRYERESIVDDLNNFGPRFSLAYNPLSSGKLVIRAGAGVFYNRVLLRTIDDFTLGKQQLFLDTNTLTNPVNGKLMTAEERRAFIASNLRFPQILKSDSEVINQFGKLNKNFSRRLDGDLRIPESYQVNFGIERDLGHDYAIETNLTFTRGIHLWREFNANAPQLPEGFPNFTSYLASRDFPNFRNSSTNNRPIYNATTAGELVRFVFRNGAPNPNIINRVVEFGVPVSIFNLNSPTSTTALDAALAALNDLRPDSGRAEVEQLISAGNSFYRGLTIELRRRFISARSGFNISFRAGYTLSKLVDDGVVNTSDALAPGDFRAERARSLLDRRHRFVFSGVFNLPPFLGSLQLSPLCRVASGAPFNISIGGTDRNLDDVGNDRPNFQGEMSLLRWRRPGAAIDASLVDAFSLPSIGQSGNLPRNAGHGPGLFLFDLNVTREFRIGDRIVVRPMIEFDNVLNKTVFSFGSEFINFNALSPSATAEQRQAFLDSFLLTTRTMRPRQIRVGLKVDF